MERAVQPGPATQGSVGSPSLQGFISPVDVGDVGAVGWCPRCSCRALLGFCDE